MFGTCCFRLCVDCNVGAPRGIAHCILRKSRRSTHMLKHHVTILLTYSLRLSVDCNVGAPRGIAHCILRKSRRSTLKLRLQGPQSLYVTSNRCLLVLEVWSVRRFRAWRRGLMQPIWQVVNSIRPLQFFFSGKHSITWPGGRRSAK